MTDTTDKIACTHNYINQIHLHPVANRAGTSYSASTAMAIPILKITKSIISLISMQTFLREIG